MVGIHTITDVPKYKWIEPEERMEMADENRAIRLTKRRKREFLEGLGEVKSQGITPEMLGEMPSKLSTNAVCTKSLLYCHI